MTKFRNIRVKKRGGGTRIQRAQVLASGKLKFVKNTSGRKPIVIKKKLRARSTGSSIKSRKSSRTSRVKRVIRKASPKRIMARRRTRRSPRRSSSSGIMATIKRFAKPALIALGVPAGVTLVGSALGNPGLGNNKLVNAGAAFAVAGPVAGIASLFLTPGGIFGGGGGNGNMEGFA